LPLPLIAEHTRRVQFGTAIAVAFARSPMILAHTRGICRRNPAGDYTGLGTQVKAHIERRFGMTWEAPAPKLREMIQALRAIWDGWAERHTTQLSGQFYQAHADDTFFQPRPD